MKHTNKRILVKGIKFVAISLPLMFLGPYFITLSFLNKTNFTFYVFLVIGGAFAISAIVLAFKGINTIVRSLFE